MAKLIHILFTIAQTFFLVSGFYTLSRNLRRRKSLFAGLIFISTGFSLFFLLNAGLSVSENHFIIYLKLGWIFCLMAISLFYYISNRYFTFSESKIAYQLSKIFYLYGLYVFYLITFTNQIINYDSISIFGGLQITKFRFSTSESYSLFYLYIIFGFMISTMNFLALYLKKRKLQFSDRYLYLTIGSCMFTFGAVIMFNRYLAYKSTHFLIFGAVMVFVGSLFISYATTRYDVFIEKPLLYSRDLFPKLLILILISMIYFGCTVLLLNFLDRLNIILTITTLAIMTHLFWDWGYKAVLESFPNKHSNLCITKSEVLLLLNNFSQKYKLEQSKFLNSKQVKMRAYNKKLTRAEALQVIIKNSILRMEAKNSSHIRSKSRLKFEIIKMIAFDDAKESQILWDLGFDSYSLNPGLAGKPRFLSRRNSEYKAGSIASFRRLKNEALRDFAWEFEQMINN